MPKNNRTILQRILSEWWFCKTRTALTGLRITDAGLVEMFEGDNKTVRKLSVRGREYLLTGRMLVRGHEEDFLEPE